jgi:hypothetical protein
MAPSIADKVIPDSAIEPITIAAKKLNLADTTESVTPAPVVEDVRSLS